jgi:hypothetical protein
MTRLHHLFGTAVMLCALGAMAAEAPRVANDGHHANLVVDGKPFLILGGELHNSTASDAATLAPVFARLAAAHLNTVLLPVYWEQMEPQPGHFDFTQIDAAIEAARANRLRLGVLWFGSWKNGMSGYAPEWIKRDASRYPRMTGDNGLPVEVLSTFSENNFHADRDAFVALMRHLRERDAVQQTVLLVQVENEVGLIGSRRDRSAAADAAFRAPVPQKLIDELKAQLPASTVWNGKTHGSWSELFGDSADEWFMAWQYASYIGGIAEAGKHEYALPMFVNAQLPAPFERAGEYPSGGPHPANLPIWRATAKALDFAAPDIYWPDFELWCQRYKEQGMPLLIPEARGGDTAAVNALFALGEAGAIGFSPFAIDDLKDNSDPIAQSYATLEALLPEILAARSAGGSGARVLHENSPRASRTLALGGYLFRSELAREWSTGALQAKDGAVLVIATAPDEFLVAGIGLRVTVARDADAGPGIAGLASVDEVTRSAAGWKTLRRMSGDENNQGRTLLFPAHEFAIFRVRMYTTPVTGR